LSDEYDWFRPEDLPRLFAALRLIPSGGILVGGQSLVFWADLVGVSVPEVDGNFLTQDADILGSKQDAILVAQCLSTTPIFPEPGDATPNTAIIRYETPDGRTLHLDFLGRIIGPAEAEIIRDKVVIDHREHGIITVMHPRHVLQSRLANLFTLPNKRNTNGVAQAKVAVQMIAAFNLMSLDHVHVKSTERHHLKFFEWLLEVSLTEQAMLCYHYWGIDVMDAAPIDKITSQDFHSIRYPQAMKDLDQKRSKSIWLKKHLETLEIELERKKELEVVLQKLRTRAT